MTNDQTAPKVSILIPLYNQERYFKDCMRSVESQTYKNLEIIIVNDGSKDRSPQMARDWAARDSRVRVIDKQNEGLAYARRDGLLAATGDYVSFLDSDDMLMPNAIETMLSPMLEKDVDLVLGLFDKKLGFYKRRKADKDYKFPFNEVVSQPELFDKYYIGFFRNDVFPASACAKLYRKSILDKAYKDTDLYSEEIRFMGEDQYFNLKLFPYLRSMYRIDETVYIYRFGGGTFGYNKYFPQVFNSSDKRLKLLDQFHYDQGYQPLFAEYVACLYFHASRLITCKVTDKEGIKDYFRDEIEHRELMPRLLEYYTEHGAPDKRTQSLLDRDYEGMYDSACDINRQRFGSLKGKIRRRIIRLMVRLS